MKQITCVIMDWAGTAVDYGCFAPLNAFLKVFAEEKGIDITYRQAREPMGLLKIDHIKAILSMPEVAAKYFTTPIPHVIDTLNLLRAQGIKIGSTTGYTDKMMKIVLAGAREKGYTVDNLVTPDQVPAGRPYPYMIYKNMIDLAVPSVDEVVKVGDTITDIKEGLNAKVWTIGVISGSNEMGITEEEYNQLKKTIAEQTTLKEVEV